MTTAFTVWAIGFVFLFLVVTDGPPYPSRDSLLWAFVAALLWPVLLVAIPSLMLFLRLTKDK